MTETTNPDDGSAERGMSLEDAAALGPLPGVVADYQSEQRGEDDSSTGDTGGRGILGALFSRGPSSGSRD